MDKKILLIVEGEADEVKFLKRLFKICSKKTYYKIYTYKTTIHILAQEIFNNYNDFDDGDIDIKLILASLEKNKQKKELFYENYTDVFMIFDFDPHHDYPHFDTIKRMIKYFDDSTNQGKLFLNYPMMQSYKHFDKLPCPEFEFLNVSLKEIKEYKKVVGEISNFTDLDKYDYITYYSIAVHQIKKANKIINGKYEMPLETEYMSFDLCKIYDFELQEFVEKQKVWVLNTCIFSLVDFAPNKFFDFISKHKDILLIN